MIPFPPLFTPQFQQPRRAAFSMIEALIVVAVLGVLSASAITFFSSYHRDVMLKVRNQRNAQEITALAMGATAAGATVIQPGDMEGTILNLIEGRKGTVGTFKGRIFRISALSEDEIAGALEYLGWHDGIPAYVPVNDE
jgi:prepilin-type N-terminal cleavage/methylation domain-containing protein